MPAGAGEFVPLHAGGSLRHTRWPVDAVAIKVVRHKAQPLQRRLEGPVEPGRVDRFERRDGRAVVAGVHVRAAGGGLRRGAEVHSQRGGEIRPVPGRFNHPQRGERRGGHEAVPGV